ncbi:MAG: signal peptidase II [bacterium]
MRVLYVTVVIVVLDQVSKLLIKGFHLPWVDLYQPGVPIGSSYSIIGDFLRLTYIENPGMVFGIDPGGKLFLTLFSLIAAIGIFVYLIKIRKESLIIRISLAMILGGAIGNFIDRMFYGVFFGEAPLFYGRVVDFIDVDFFTINFLGFHMSRFPIFNIADASVTCGVILLLIFHRRFTIVEKSASQPVIEPVPVAAETPNTPGQAPRSDFNSPSV